MKTSYLAQFLGNKCPEIRKMNKTKDNLRYKCNLLLQPSASKQVKYHFQTNKTNKNLFGITIDKGISTK